MACKEDLDRLLQDEDKYSELYYSPAQRDQSQLLFYKRYAFIASFLLTLSIILNAILFSSRATQFTIMSHHDRSEYGSLLNCFYLPNVILTFSSSKSGSGDYSYMAKTVRLLER